jgi:hypothetical protein
MSFGALTYFAGHLIFHQIKVSQMMNWSAPLRRARRDDWNRYIISYIWSLESRDINPNQNQVEKNLEDTRRRATEGGAEPRIKRY